MFAQPASTSGFDLSSNEGSLLLFRPTGTRSVATAYGESDAVEATVGVIDGANAGDVITGALVFPKILQSQLTPSINKTMVIGRLGRGTAKPGQSAPWVLNEYTQEDLQAVQEFYNKNSDKF